MKTQSKDKLCQVMRAQHLLHLWSLVLQATSSSLVVLYWKGKLIIKNRKKRKKKERK